MNLDAMLLELGKYAAGKPHKRLLLELGYARRVSLAEEGRYDALIKEAMEVALQDIRENEVATMELVHKVEQMLAPMAAACKRYSWMVVGHAHIDMNWMWRYDETVSIVLDTFRTMLNLMKEHPGFTFGQSQASTYAIVQEYEPEMLEEIKERIQAGQWEVTASSWVEADHNMPNMESETRHLLYTKRYLSELLGISAESLNLDFSPDTFGHNAYLPDLLSQAGVRYFYHCRGEQGQGLYRWRGASGGELVCLLEPDWYCGSAINDESALRVPEFCRDFHMPAMLTVYGVGDHGGGPTRRDLNHIEDMMTWPIFPTVKYGTYRAFFEMAEANKAHFPVLEGERNVMFSGCYTAQSRIKQGNSMAEKMLFKSELFSAFAHKEASAPYRRAGFEGAWRKVLFNHFHDIVTGSGVCDTRDYALGQYQQAFAAANSARRAAYAAIAAKVDTRSVAMSAPLDSTSEGAGVGFGIYDYELAAVSRGGGSTRIFHLFNALPRKRALNCELTLWDYTEPAERMEFVDGQGKTLEHQVLDSGYNHYWGHHYRKVLVWAAVPACGYQTVILRPKEAVAPISFNDPGEGVRVEHPLEMVLENELVRAEFDSATGRLTRFTDKTTGQVRLAGAGFDFIEEDPSEGMTSWRVGRYMNIHNAGTRVKVSRAAWGSLRQGFKVSAEFATASRLEYTVYLDKGSRRLVYEVNCDWHELGSGQTILPQLSFSADLTDQAEEFLYRVPGGELLRTGTPQDKPALGAMAAEGVALMCDSRYGFRGDGRTMRVALVRGSVDPDPIPEKGEIKCKVALEIMDGEALSRKAEDFTMPMDAVSGESHAGELPMEHSFMRLKEGDVEISGLKLSEDADELVLHLSSRIGSAQRTVLEFDQGVEAKLCDLLEKPAEGECMVQGNRISLDLPAHGVRAVRVKLMGQR